MAYSKREIHIPTAASLHLHILLLRTNESVGTWRQHPVDLAGLVKSLAGVILHRGAFVEMDRDWELAGVHLDDRRRHSEQFGVVCEVFYPQSG